MKIARYKIALAVLDYIFLNLSFAIALRIRFYPDIDIIDLSSGFVINEVLLFALISLLFIYFFENNQLYKYQVFTNSKLHMVKLLRTILIDILITIMIFTFLFKAGSKFESRLFIITFVLVSSSIFYIYRVLIFRNIFIGLLKTGLFRSKVIIYGAGDRGKQVMKMVCSNNRWRFLGFVDDEKKKNVKGHILGDFSRLQKLCEHGLVNSVIISIDDISHEKLQELIDELIILDLRIFVVSELYDVLVNTQELEIIGDLPLVEVNYNSKHFHISFTKRVTDLIFALIGIAILSPLFLAIAGIIKITSKGPVIFVQTRVGKNGEQFKFYKYRSMYSNNIPDVHKNFVKDFINGKKGDGPQKIENDARITPIGKFIRKTSIDELPQLFNVVKGDMSLVGPRPCLPYEYEMYKDWHKSRFMIKPGCTGVWQVSGRSEVTFDEMVVMDYYYIHNMSPWLDVKLMLKTLPVMFFGKGGF